MRLIFFTALILFSIQSFSQKKKSNKVVRDQYNIEGNATINNYYINPPSKGEKRQKLIDATIGYFSKIKDTNSHLPVLRIGGTKSSGNGLRNGGEGHDISFGEPVDPIRVIKNDGQILIFGTARDTKGNPFARFSGSSWEITEKSGIEYNNDGTAFEVTNGGRVVFQLNIVKDTVFYNGLMCNEGGYCQFLCPTCPMVFPPVKIVGTQRFSIPIDFIVAPLFKYPRYEYLGVREKPKAKK